MWRPTGTASSAEPFAHRLADLPGQGGLDLRRKVGERLDLLARPLERCLDVAGIDTSLRGCGQTFLRTLDRSLVHAGKVP